MVELSILLRLIHSLCLFRDLNEDPRAIRKRVEKDKATDKDWATFKQNPARFTQVSSVNGSGYNQFIPCPPT